MRRTLRKARARGSARHQVDMAWGWGAVGVVFSSKPEVSSQYIGPRVRQYTLKAMPLPFQWSCAGLWSAPQGVRMASNREKGPDQQPQGIHTTYGIPPPIYTGVSVVHPLYREATSLHILLLVQNMPL